MNLTLFEAEQAAEVVRAAANTDINTIFGSVINENLTDEVIVTVIATGFDKQAKAKETTTIAHKPVQQPETIAPIRRTRVESTPTLPPKIEKLDEDEDDGEESIYDTPSFLRPNY